MRDFYGIQPLGFLPEQLDDQHLLQQFMSVVRARYFIAESENGDKQWKINHQTMRDNYGIWLCDEEVQHLSDEMRRRTDSKECLQVLSEFDCVIAKRGKPMAVSSTDFINTLQQVRHGDGSDNGRSCTSTYCYPITEVPDTLLPTRGNAIRPHSQPSAVPA